MTAVAPGGSTPTDPVADGDRGSSSVVRRVVDGATGFAFLGRGGSFLLWFLVGHVVLGLAISLVAAVATVHAWVSAGLLVRAVLDRTKLREALFMLAYVGSCDVLWRVGDARFPYEGSKYLLIIGGIVLIVRSGRSLIGLWPSICLLAALVPSIVYTVLIDGVGRARTAIPFNLAGLAGIAVMAALGRRVRANPAEYTSLLILVAAPPLALVTVSTFSTLTAVDLRFNGESNFVTSGGFGPNQVSASLALGAVCALLSVFSPVLGGRIRLVLAGAGLWMVGQAVLTFSRGGVYGFTAAFVAAALVGLGSSENRRRALALMAAVVLAAVVVVPVLDNFTGGELAIRYQTSDGFANRTEIASAEWEMFLQNPMFGVGPGRASDVTNFNSHTEFSRLLAEHGSLGVLALACLGWIVVGGVLRARPGWNRMVSVSLFTWALLELSHSATRTSTLPVAFLLACVSLSDPPVPQGSDELRSPDATV